MHLATANFRSPAALSRFFLTAILGLVADLWTKSYAFAKLSGPHGRSEVNEFIPGWLHFTITTNTGAVFGWGEGNRVLFVAVSIAAILFLSWLFAASDRQRFYQVILGMLLAGVLGNLYDRIVYGHVRDMIHALPQWPNLFPWVFNVADVLLCTGVGLLVIYSLFQHKENPTANPATQRG